MKNDVKKITRSTIIIVIVISLVLLVVLFLCLRKRRRVRNRSRKQQEPPDGSERIPSSSLTVDGEEAQEQGDTLPVRLEAHLPAPAGASSATLGMAPSHPAVLNKETPDGRRMKSSRKGPIIPYQVVVLSAGQEDLKIRNSSEFTSSGADSDPTAARTVIPGIYHHIAQNKHCGNKESDPSVSGVQPVSPYRVVILSASDEDLTVTGCSHLEASPSQCDTVFPCPPSSSPGIYDHISHGKPVRRSRSHEFLTLPPAWLQRDDVHIYDLANDQQLRSASATNIYDLPNDQHLRSATNIYSLPNDVSPAPSGALPGSPSSASFQQATDDGLGTVYNRLRFWHPPAVLPPDCEPPCAHSHYSHVELADSGVTDSHNGGTSKAKGLLLGCCIN